MTSVFIKRLPHAQSLPLPSKGTSLSAGFDLSACLETPITLESGAFQAIPTGYAIALEPGYEAQVRPRSGLAAKNGITVLNTPGTIDADYRGEIKVILINHSKVPFTIEHGMRIAQLVVATVCPVEFQEVENLPENLERGERGFGSTGY